jgi:hypothetical protein
MKQKKKEELVFEGVPSTNLIERWGLISPLLVRALESGPEVMSLIDVWDALMRRDMQLWVASEGDRPIAVAVTQILNWPQSRCCEIFLVAGGKLENFVDFERVISDWAEAEGCDFLQITGRAGWERILDTAGWKRSAVLLTKGLQ